jgi:SSS family solute:Na+ symporter
MGVVFLVTLVLAVVISLLTNARAGANRIDTAVDYRTSRGFNVAALAVLGVLAALYATWW